MMKTIWDELAEFIKETERAAQSCGVTSYEMLALFITLKNGNGITR